MFHALIDIRLGADYRARVNASALQLMDAARICEQHGIVINNDSDLSRICVFSLVNIMMKFSFMSTSFFVDFSATILFPRKVTHFL